MSDEGDLVTEINDIVVRERELGDAITHLKEKFPDVFSELDELETQLKEVNARKSRVKSQLEKAHDFDVYDTDTARVSLSEIIRVDIADIEKIPEEYKETRVVANIKKAENHLRLYGTLPQGFVNKSYTRLSWRNKTDDNK